MTETTEPQPRDTFSPPAGVAAANPYRMVLFGTCPCRTSCCPAGIAKLTVVDAQLTPVPADMKQVLAPAVGHDQITLVRGGRGGVQRRGSGSGGGDGGEIRGGDGHTGSLSGGDW